MTTGCIKTLGDALAAPDASSLRDVTNTRRYLSEVRRIAKPFQKDNGRLQDVFMTAIIDLPKTLVPGSRKYVSINVSDDDPITNPASNPWGTSMSVTGQFDDTKAIVSTGMTVSSLDYESQLTLYVGIPDDPAKSLQRKSNVTMLTSFEKSRRLQRSEKAVRSLRDHINDWISDVRMVTSVVTGTAEPQLVLKRDDTAGLPFGCVVAMHVETNPFSQGGDDCALLAYYLRRMLSLPQEPLLEFLRVCVL